MNKKFLPAILVFVTAFANAQQTFTNFGNLQVHAGASLSGFGNFVNTSGGALVNNGNLYVRGNITNDQASMASGSGTLYLNGSSAQALGGSQAFRTFRLTTNNTAGITLNNNLAVADLHTFTNGIITTSVTPNYLVYEAGSSYTGDADARHVNGWVKKIGSTDFSFPVGNGTYVRKIGVTNLSAVSEFNSRHRTSTPNHTTVASPLFQVDLYEYWEVNRVSGGSAQIAMNWDNSKIQFPDYVLSEIRAAYYNAGVWTDQGGSATGNVYTAGSITSSAVSSFGYFTMGSIGWTLPLQFISISAEWKQGSALIKWQTAHELNVSHFEIERSAGIGDFRAIGKVDALNANGSGRYQHTDQTPLSGTSFYRIRGIDINGKQTYSAIAVLNPGQNARVYFNLVKNPVSTSILLTASDNYAGNYKYELFNTGGQSMQNGNVNIPGSAITAIPLTSAIRPGVYVLHLRNENYRLTEKVIVE